MGIKKMNSEAIELGSILIDRVDHGLGTDRGQAYDENVPIYVHLYQLLK